MPNVYYSVIQWARRVSGFYLLLLLGCLVLVRPGGAAATTTFWVTKTADTNDGVCDADCSLREAIDAANNAAGADTITFALPTDSTIILSGSQLPPIADTLTIDGRAVPGLVINGGNDSRVFQVDSGATATLTHLTIADGELPVNGLCPADCGGGILNQGNLTVLNSTLIDNWATVGGGIHNLEGAVLTVRNATFSDNFGGYGGGGLENHGTLTLANSTLSDNYSPEVWGAGLYNLGTAALYNTILANNSGGDCRNAGTITASQGNLVEEGDCPATYNSDPQLGSLQNNSGATWTYAPLQGSPVIDTGDDSSCATTDQRDLPRPQDGDGDGAAICDIGAVEIAAAQGGSMYSVNATSDPGDGTCTLDQCTLREAMTAANLEPGPNTIGFGLPADSVITLNGQALPMIVESVVIDGSAVARLTVSGNHASNIFDIDEGVAATIRYLIIAEGSGGGGGIRNRGDLTLSYSVVRDGWDAGPWLASGAGIGNNGHLWVDHSLVANNILTSEYGNQGAGIHNSGVLTLTYSTVSDNAITHNQTEERGGGLYNAQQAHATISYSTLSGNQAGQGGAIWSGGQLTVMNSTISQNTAGHGGGIFQYQEPVTLKNSTLSGNTATQSGYGGNLFLELGVLYWWNTIMANGVGGDCAENMGDVAGSEQTLAEDGSCLATFSGDPLLGPLQANGGATATHALLPGSPAVDAGDPASCLADDQRGVIRPKDGDGDGTPICDMGAFELVRVTDFVYLPVVGRN
jgi:CSLREA domain-containing protein